MTAVGQAQKKAESLKPREEDTVSRRRGGGQGNVGPRADHWP